LWVLHMLQWLYTYVASVLFQMFQMLQTYDARVLSGCCICFTHMVGSVSSRCCIYFTHMFHTYVASVSFECCICSAMATHVFPWCFIHMLQVFQWIQTYNASVLYLDIAKVDLMLHILQWDPSVAATYCSCWARLHARTSGRGATVRAWDTKQCGTRSARGPRWAQDTKWRGPRCGARDTIRGHGVAQSPHEASATGAGIRTLAPFEHPGARHTVFFSFCTRSDGIISRLKNTVSWFFVREKYCSGWKNKPNKTDYKPDEQGLESYLHWWCNFNVVASLTFRFTPYERTSLS
jgi:hypothetical protein